MLGLQGGTGGCDWPDVSGMRGRSGVSGVQWEMGGHWPDAKVGSSCKKDPDAGSH